MKDQVENMEAEMSKLLANMNNIATNCSVIETRFKPNRSEIEKLVGVRGLLKKLEFLFELPTRLRKNIELGAYDRAVKYFKMATSILSSYKHVESFNRISIESQEIINDLQENLKKQMIQKNITATKQLEIAKLLLSLNQQPELLWYDIFKTRKDSLMATIVKLKTSQKIIDYYDAQKISIDDDDKKDNDEKVLDKTNPFSSDMDNDNNNNNKKSNAFFSVIDHFKVGFLSLFIDFVEQYNSVFITPFEKKNKSTFEKSMAALTSFTREIFSEYFNVIKQCLQKENNIDKLTEELQSFYDGLYNPSKLVPNARLQDKGTEIIESCIRTSMEREFINTRKKQLLFLINHMNENYDISKIIINSDSYDITNNEYHIKKCVNFIKVCGTDCLNHLVPLTTNQSQLINILDLNFDDQLWSYTANIFKIFNEIIPIELRINNDNDNQQINNIINMINQQDNIEEIKFIENIYNILYTKMKPIKLLILSKIFIGIANNVVEEIVKHFKKNFLYDRSDRNTSLGIYKQEVLLFKKYCQECSNGLRLMYSQRISINIINNYIDKLESNINNINNDENKRKEIIINIQNNINKTIENMKKIYNISDELINCHIHQKDNNINNKYNSNNSNDNLREYDKLFNEGCLIYDIVLDNANSVLFTIYKIIFKHWSEILRLQIINQLQFKNIVNNIKYFRNNIPKIINKKDFKKLQTLLDEIQQSAKERCIVIKSHNTGDDTVDID